MKSGTLRLLTVRFTLKLFIAALFNEPDEQGYEEDEHLKGEGDSSDGKQDAGHDE